MKKIVLILLAAMMVFVLVGCSCTGCTGCNGKQKEKASESTTEPEGTIEFPTFEDESTTGAKETTTASTTKATTTTAATTKAPETTTAQPTTKAPETTTAQPTTKAPETTTAEPTTAEPTTAEPTTAEPTTAEPTTAEPTTAEPTTPEPTTAEEPTKVVGGWQLTDVTQLAISQEDLKVFEDATKDWTGGTLKPVAVLAKQVVNGTNYCYLAWSKTLDGKNTAYFLMYIYENLNGTLEITGTKDIDVEADEYGDFKSGNWDIQEIAKGAQYEDVFKEAFDEAKIVGMTARPVACLGTKVTSGTDYKFLVEATRTTKTVSRMFAVITVHKGAEGKATIDKSVDFDFLPETVNENK